MTVFLKVFMNLFIFVFCSHTPPFAETIPPAGSPRISIPAVPSDIRNSMCTPLYNETLRGCFTVGEKKKIKKLMINGELVIEWKKEKSIKDVVVENICYD